MRKTGRPRGSLYAIAVAIEANAARDPYPRLAQLMRTLAYEPPAHRALTRAAERLQFAA